MAPTASDRPGPPSPPGQPASGPGGADYPHGQSLRSGPFWAGERRRNNALRYFIYEPADPAPRDAPVVLFLHGWQAYRPDMYGAWMRHMARKGYLVVWAQYDHNMIGVLWWRRNAAAAWRDALARLARPDARVAPERHPSGEIKTAMVGHSAGAYLSFMLAAQAAAGEAGFPRPAAIVAVEPGWRRWIPGADLSRIPPETKMLLVVGDADTISRFDTALTLWKYTPQVPRANKAFLLVRSDDRGQPAQIANHFFPNCDGYRDTADVDARDYYVTFRLSVAALNCVFRDRDCQIAFGNEGAGPVDMGSWSDGVPVTPMLNLDPERDAARLTLRPR